MAAFVGEVLVSITTKIWTTTKAERVTLRNLSIVRSVGSDGLTVSFTPENFEGWVDENENQVVIALEEYHVFTSLVTCLTRDKSDKALVCAELSLENPELKWVVRFGDTLKISHGKLA